MTYQIAVYSTDHRLILDEPAATLGDALTVAGRYVTAKTRRVGVPYTAEIRDGHVTQMVFARDARRRDWEEMHLAYAHDAATIIIQSEDAYREHLADRAHETMRHGG